MAVFEDSDGSPEGADHAQTWRAYPAVVSSVIDARVVESVGATVNNARYTVRED